MSWISRDVRDDYGSIVDRTIYRYVKRLVAKRKIVKVELGLNFAAYVKPTSRFLRTMTIEELREYMLGLVEITACAKDAA